MRMPDPDEIRAFKAFMDKHMGGKREVVSKTYPIKPEWKKTHDEAVKLAKEVAEKEAKITSMRAGMWAAVEQELGIYGEHLQYNSDTNEIELMEEVAKGKPVKSPFQSKDCD